MSNQTRYWSFTLNNPAQWDSACIIAMRDEVNWYVYQLEQGEEQTPHWQGSCCFKRSKRLTGVKRMLDRAHWEPTRNVQASIKYCQKEEGRLEDPVIFGTLPLQTQGKRTDLEALVADIKAGASEAELLAKHTGTMMRYARNVQLLRTSLVPDRDFKPNVMVFIGAPGSGKTRAATSCFGVYYIALGVENGKLWMDGYDPMVHNTVIFDDFYGGVKWTELLQVCDRYPHRCHVKGSTVKLLARTIIFTSNKEPILWYPNQDFAALDRRIDCILRFTRMAGGETSVVPLKGEIPAAITQMLE